MLQVEEARKQRESVRSAYLVLRGIRTFADHIHGLVYEPGVEESFAVLNTNQNCDAEQVDDREEKETADALSSTLRQMQGQIASMQQKIDSLAVFLTVNDRGNFSRSSTSNSNKHDDGNILKNETLDFNNQDNDCIFKKDKSDSNNNGDGNIFIKDKYDSNNHANGKIFNKDKSDKSGKVADKDESVTVSASTPTSVLKMTKIDNSESMEVPVVPNYDEADNTIIDEKFFDGNQMRVSVHRAKLTETSNCESKKSEDVDNNDKDMTDSIEVLDIDDDNDDTNKEKKLPRSSMHLAAKRWKKYGKIIKTDTGTSTDEAESKIVPGKRNENDKDPNPPASDSNFKVKREMGTLPNVTNLGAMSPSDNQKKTEAMSPLDNSKKTEAMSPWDNNKTGSGLSAAAADVRGQMSPSYQSMAGTGPFAGACCYCPCHGADLSRRVPGIDRIATLNPMWGTPTSKGCSNIGCSFDHRPKSRASLLLHELETFDRKTNLYPISMTNSLGGLYSSRQKEWQVGNFTYGLIKRSPHDFTELSHLPKPLKHNPAHCSRCQKRNLCHRKDEFNNHGSFTTDHANANFDGHLSDS